MWTVSQSGIASWHGAGLPGPSLEDQLLRYTIDRGDVIGLRSVLQFKRLPESDLLALIQHACRNPNCSADVKRELLGRISTPQAALDIAVLHNDLALARMILENRQFIPHLPHAGATRPDMLRLLRRERRRRLLYSHDAGTQGDTALDAMLRAGQFAQAEAHLQQALNEFGLRCVWASAVRHKRLDALRALLVLGKVDEDLAFRLDEGAAGMKLKDKIGDATLAAMIKEVPQISPKRKCVLNLNAVNEDIVCRHLTYYWQREQGVQSGTGTTKFNYGDMQTIQDVESHVRITETELANLYALSPEVHLVNAPDLGAAIAGMFRDMEKKNEQARLLTWLTSIHAMGIELQTRLEGGKKKRIVRFFDPNLTTTHVRHTAASMDVVEALSGDAYLQPGVHSVYFPNSSNASLLMIRPPEAVLEEHAPARVPVSANRKLSSRLDTIDTEVMYLLLSRGFAGNLRELKATFRVQDRDRLIQLLEAKSSEGDPGLLMALQEGHADTVRAYAELLSLVPPDRRVDLVAAKNMHRTPGLFMALCNGHADAISAYGDLLKLLPSERRVEVIAAMIAEGVSGLFMALQNGHADAIRAYGALLRMVPTGDVFKLLDVKVNGGVSGLLVACQKGHADAVLAYGELLSMVSPDQAFQLLESKEDGGISALFVALEQGHADVISAIGKFLKLVNPEQRAELVEAKDSSGTSGLCTALRYDHADAIDEFDALLKTLPLQRQVALLADAAGALVAAMRHRPPYVAAMDAYLRICTRVAPSLDADQRNNLLNAIRASHGTKRLKVWINYAYYAALKGDHPEFYERFKTLKNLLKTPAITQQAQASVASQA